MSERNPGYYMIRYAHEQASWEPAEWDGELWILLGSGGLFSPATIREIGPRIPTPEDPWQCVPIHATNGMIGASGHDHRQSAIYTWDAMLKEAPKP